MYVCEQKRGRERSSSLLCHSIGLHTTLLSMTLVLFLVSVLQLNTQTVHFFISQSCVNFFSHPITGADAALCEGGSPFLDSPGEDVRADPHLLQNKDSQTESSKPKAVY